MSNVRLSFAMVVGLLLVFFMVDVGLAKYRYQYVNDKGEVLFADDLQSVPAKYQGQAMIVSTEVFDEKAEQAAAQERAQSAAQAEAVMQERAAQQAAEQQAAGMLTAEQQSAGRHARTSPERRLHIGWTIGALGAFLAVLIILPKIEALKYHQKAVAGVRSALTILLLAYLVFAHGKDVTYLFGTAGDTIAGMERKSAEKGKKAAQFYKEMENMMEEMQTVQKDQAAQYKEFEERQ